MNHQMEIDIEVSDWDLFGKIEKLTIDGSVTIHLDGTQSIRGVVYIEAPELGHAVHGQFYKRANQECFEYTFGFTWSVRPIVTGGNKCQVQTKIIG